VHFSDASHQHRRRLPFVLRARIQRSKSNFPRCQSDVGWQHIPIIFIFHPQTLSEPFEKAFHLIFPVIKISTEKISPPLKTACFNNASSSEGASTQCANVNGIVIAKKR
jgi:hypothetical protein